MPLVAVIYQHELLRLLRPLPPCSDLVVFFCAHPSLADLAGGPKSSNDEGTGSILQRPVPCGCDAGKSWTDAVPKFACKLQTRCSRPGGAPNHKMFRNTSEPSTRQYVRAVGRGVSGACSGRPLTLRLTNFGLAAPGLLRALYMRWRHWHASPLLFAQRYVIIYSAVPSTERVRERVVLGVVGRPRHSVCGVAWPIQHARHDGQLIFSATFPIPSLSVNRPSAWPD